MGGRRGVDSGRKCSSWIFMMQRSCLMLTCGFSSSGLGNLYYWIDPKEGLLGLIMTSVLPFMDKDVLYLYDAMEKAAYGNLQEIGKSKDGGKGSNYQIP